MSQVLIGGTGLLGSGFAEAFHRRREASHRLAVRWSSAGTTAEDLDGLGPQLLSGRPPHRVVWAAGTGHVGAGPAAMQLETDAIKAMCSVIRRLPEEHREALTVMFASSAGALFGGYGNAEVAADSAPLPITAYGHEKLRQEDLLREVAETTGCRVVACRFSNVYGLASGEIPTRGLVAAAVKATRLRQPLTVYVRRDTRRDLIYNTDAALWALDECDRARPGFTPVLVHDGTTRTIGEIIARVGAVSGRRVPVNYGDRPETSLQPLVLRFATSRRTTRWVRTPFEVALHRMLRAPVRVG